jgi:hypothetical protein
MKRILGLLAICMMAAGVAGAQTGSVTGLVVDEMGAAVEGARVSLHADGQCVGYVFTGADGAYLLEDVAAGVYTIKAGKPQVGNATLEDIEVLEGEITQVPDLVLSCSGGSGSGSGGGSGPHGPKFKHQNQYGGGE